jgi:hypothetical protein
MASGLLVEIHTIHLLDSLHSYRYNNLFDMRNGISRSIKISRAVIHLTRLSALKSLSSFVAVKASRQNIDMQQTWMAYSIATAHMSRHMKQKTSAVG